MGFLRCNLTLAPRHTKEVAFKTLVRPQLEYEAPIWHPFHDTQIAQVEKVQRTAARWTCRRWRNTSSFGDMLDELEWPFLEALRKQSSLAFFYKIHSGTVSFDKDKYLTPAPNIRSTRASHEFQSPDTLLIAKPCRIHSSPGLFQSGIASFPRWPHLRPLRSLRLSFKPRVQMYAF